MLQEIILFHLFWAHISISIFTLNFLPSSSLFFKVIAVFTAGVCIPNATFSELLSSPVPGPAQILEPGSLPGRLSPKMSHLWVLPAYASGCLQTNKQIPLCHPRVSKKSSGAGSCFSKLSKMMSKCSSC